MFLPGFLVVLVQALVLLTQEVDGLSTTFVYGPQSRELLLLTAKIAAKDGIDTSFVCAPGTESGCRNLMYGPAYAAAGKDDPGNAKPICQPEDMQRALERAECMILIGYDSPIDEKTINTFLEFSGDNLYKLVLLSKIGVSRAKGGFLGGGDDVKLLECEKLLSRICKDRNLGFSIVRAGSLKGGGPGEDNGNTSMALDKSYYNTILDIVESKTAEAHDKFTIGAECLMGDPLEIPSLITRMSSKSSFEPMPGETNRIVAAAACVAASKFDTDIEVTVSSHKSRQVPTMEEFQTIFSSLQ
jgi:hypothetical protein